MSSAKDNARSAGTTGGGMDMSSWRWEKTSVVRPERNYRLAAHLKGLTIPVPDYTDGWHSTEVMG